MLGFRRSVTAVEPAIASAFRQEEWRGAQLAAIARLGALGAMAVWVVVRVAGPAALYYLAIVAVLALSGLGQLWASRRSGLLATTLGYALVTLDMAVLTVALATPNPLAPPDWPAAMQLRLGNFDLFYVLIAFAVLGFRPTMPVWAAISAGVTWSLGVLWVLAQPGSFTAGGRDLQALDDIDRVLALLLDPNYVSSVIWTQEMIIAAVVAAILSIAVWRARRLALRQARLSRERANLSRYFPPTVVDQLAQLDEPLGSTRQQPVAVMFADIVGFTEFAERSPPDEVVATLRTFHVLLEQAIFDHGGTLDKFLGDGVMATFGTPQASPEDPGNALAAARAMLAAVGAWNRERVAAGAPHLHLSIGIHYGNVVLGDIGSERRLEFAVLGDVVNVASRIEHLSRELATPLVVSDALVQAAQRAATVPSPVLAGLRAATPQTLRGRSEPVAVWTLAAAA